MFSLAKAVKRRYQSKFCQCQVLHLRGWPSPPQLYTIDCRPLRVGPDFSGLHRALPRLRLYYEPVRLPYLRGPAFASSACWGMQAIRLSQVPMQSVRWPAAVCDPGTPLQSRHITTVTILASRQSNPWPIATIKFRGSKTFTCVAADHPLSIWLHTIRYLLIRIIHSGRSASLWPGRSKTCWIAPAYLGARFELACFSVPQTGAYSRIPL